MAVGRGALNFPWCFIAPAMSGCEEWASGLCLHGGQQSGSGRDKITTLIWDDTDLVPCRSSCSEVRAVNEVWINCKEPSGRTCSCHASFFWWEMQPSCSPSVLLLSLVPHFTGQSRHLQRLTTSLLSWQCVANAVMLPSTAMGTAPVPASTADFLRLSLLKSAPVQGDLRSSFRVGWHLLLPEKKNLMLGPSLSLSVPVVFLFSTLFVQQPWVMHLLAKLQSILKIHWKWYPAYPCVNIPVCESGKGKTAWFSPSLNPERAVSFFPCVAHFKKKKKSEGFSCAVSHNPVCQELCLITVATVNA